MTKRELNYLLYQKPKRAFRLIEPKSAIWVAVRYGSTKRRKARSKQLNDSINGINIILNGGGKSKAKQIINNTL